MPLFFGILISVLVYQQTESLVAAIAFAFIISFIINTFIGITDE